MADEQTMSLIIKPKRSVFKDILANWRWIAGISVVILVYAVLSAAAFYGLERVQYIDGHERHNDFFDSFYFTIINLTTVGFGDIVPQSQLGKLLAIINSLVGVAAFGFLIAVITAALQPSEFNGNSAINKPDGPHKAPGPDPSSPRPATEPETSEHAAITFLSGLNALIGTRDQPPRQTHVHIRLAPREGHNRNTVVEVNIFVYRPPG